MSLRLDEIPSGTECFVDANIFIYHFSGVSGECSKFLRRCEEGDIVGVTATNVVLEVLHRLMMIEAVRKGLITPPNVLKKLQKSPAIVRELGDYFSNVEKISRMGIRILSFSWETVKSSQAIRARYGLMVNDSIIVAVMNEKGIGALASNDDAFEGIEDISLYRPRDITLSSWA